MLRNFFNNFLLLQNYLLRKNIMNTSAEYVMMYKKTGGGNNQL